jgi:hypothetical protein
MTQNLSYWLDNDNIICKVNESWDTHMDPSSWAERASSDVIIGKHLFDFVCDDVTRMYIATMIESVRLIPRTIVRPYRCDSPDRKRFMKMIISPEQDGLVCVSHELVREEPLPNPVLFKTLTENEIKVNSNKKPGASGLDYLIRCSICNSLKNRRTGIWQEVDTLATITKGTSKPLTVVYGVCPICMRKLRRQNQSVPLDLVISSSILIDK